MMSSNICPDELERWTWKDTLDRIQYIDEIIAQIVKDGLTVNTFLLTLYAALAALNGLIPGQNLVLLFTAIIISFFGAYIDNIMAKNLARQEYFRQWYFAIFPLKLLPLKPHDDWFPEKDIKDEKNNNINNYCMDVPIKFKTAYESAPDKIPVCKIGKDCSGYCESWYNVFKFLKYLFIFIGIITSIVLIFSILA